MKRPYRVVVAKPGLDGHDRGAKLVARSLRDAGFEVIYTGLHQTPEAIARVAVDEDADAVGLSLLSGAHGTLVPRVIEALVNEELEDIVIIVGGVIPEADVRELKRIGVSAVFTSGTAMPTIGEWLAVALDEREQSILAKELEESLDKDSTRTASPLSRSNIESKSM